MTSPCFFLEEEPIPDRSGLTLPMLSTSYQLFKVGFEGGASVARRKDFVSGIWPTCEKRKNVRETKDSAYVLFSIVFLSSWQAKTTGKMRHHAYSQVVQNTTQSMRRLELEAPTEHGRTNTNVSPVCECSKLMTIGISRSSYSGSNNFKAVPKSRYCRTMALAWTWYFSSFAHSLAQAVVVRQEQSTKPFSVSSAMICGSEAGGKNIQKW